MTNHPVEYLKQFTIKKIADIFPIMISKKKKKDGRQDDEESAEISKWESVIWLGLLTLFISVLSEYLVNAIEV